MALDDYICGFHSVRAALSQSPCPIQTLWVGQHLSSHKWQDIQDQCDVLGITVRLQNRRSLDERLPDINHQGIIAKIDPSLEHRLHEKSLDAFLKQLPRPASILLLDGVTDPHNLGACLRTANGAGVGLVISPKDKAAGITPVVRKVASGAVGETPFVQVINLARTMDLLKDNGFWVVGTSDQARQTLYEADLADNIALVMGAEGQGLRQNTIKHCDFLINLPMAGSVSSLNVSVATGICLYEIRRRHLPTQAL